MITEAGYLLLNDQSPDGITDYFSVNTGFSIAVGTGTPATAALGNEIAREAVSTTEEFFINFDGVNKLGQTIRRTAVFNVAATEDITEVALIHGSTVVALSLIKLDDNAPQIVTKNAIDGLTVEVPLVRIIRKELELVADTDRLDVSMGPQIQDGHALFTETYFLRNKGLYTLFTGDTPKVTNIHVERLVEQLSTYKRRITYVFRLHPADAFSGPFAHNQIKSLKAGTNDIVRTGMFLFDLERPIYRKPTESFEFRGVYEEELVVFE